VEFIPSSNRQVYCSSICKNADIKSKAASKPARIMSCKCCEKIFTATVSTSKFCSVSCREAVSKQKNKQKNIGKCCEECGVDISTRISVRKFCSEECMIKNRLSKKNIGKQGMDYLQCPICCRHVKQITYRHAKMHGFTSPRDMKKSLGIETTCQSKKDKVSGKNNPGYQHDGVLSKFSKKFIHGYDQQWHNDRKADVAKSRKEHPEKYPTSYEYWIEKCNGDEDDARRQHSKYQTRDLTYFVEKYGEEEGRRRRALKIERWSKSFKKTNFSKISQQLFDELSKHLEDMTNIYYATFDRDNMKDYKNKEYILKLADTFVRPDFIDTLSRKIIEFDGDYWHSELKANPEREKARDEKIKAEGYEIFHVAEHKYNDNKQKIIQECITFLTT
jgi:very-short-patch-repair endonuclease